MVSASISLICHLSHGLRSYITCVCILVACIYFVKRILWQIPSSSIPFNPVITAHELITLITLSRLETGLLDLIEFEFIITCPLRKQSAYK